MVKSIVSCSHVAKTYGTATQKVHALVDICLTVDRGEFMSISGPSGSGKSTLLNIIGCLDAPSSGEVWIDGERADTLSATERSELRLKKLGFIFQSYNLIPVLSAEENVEFVMQLQGVPKEVRRQRSHEVLASLGLAGLEHRRPADLSGGQQQRVAIARAIVSEPALILADEPTANLDSHTATNLLDIMRELNESRGLTFIFSTHDPKVVDRAKRLVRLEDGKIVSDERR